MSDPVIRALLVDFDGVLRTWPPSTAALAIPEAEIQRVAFSPALLGEVVRGAMSDEASRAEIASRLSVGFGTFEARSAVREWSLGCGVVVPEVRALLRRVSPRVKLVLATNATSRLPEDMRALGLADTFHFVANSSALGAGKPETAFFEAALRSIGVAPEHALFVDDFSENVIAAEALGINAHRFRGVEAMEQFLAVHGVLVDA
jgi:putative hydrolase of the HAD superfamily